MTDTRDHNTTPPPYVGSVNPPEGPPKPRRTLVAVGATALLLLLAGATIWMLTNNDDDTKAGSLSTELAKKYALSPGEAQCVIDRSKDELSEDRVSALIADPDPDDTDQATLDEILTDCSLQPEAAAEAAKPAEGEPFTYGDDAELDALWDKCSSEGTAVCDELFNRSPEGSEYEAFADTCGGRGTPQVACAPDALANTDQPPSSDSADPPMNHGDSAEFDQLWDKCAANDAQACLALAFQAPEGSEYAEFGKSCGNRPDDERCKQSD